MITNTLPSIDFVMLWVDGSDPSWQIEFNKTKLHHGFETVEFSSQRYLDWELLPFFFRGVEKFAPWVRKIHFVTNGQLPNWLNLNCPKLNCISHAEFMMENSIPAFSSHPIELQLHKIPDLAEQFVYFNDDIFILQPLLPSHFFQDGLRVDMMCEEKLIQMKSGLMEEIQANNLFQINKYFSKRDSKRQNKDKWGNHPGKSWVYNHFWDLYPHFVGFTIDHLALPFTKRIYQEVWDNCTDILLDTVVHPFRSSEDVNCWLIRYWSFASGQFAPASNILGKYFSIDNLNNLKLIESITEQKYPMICANDVSNYSRFLEIKSELNDAFQMILPDKSNFEI